MEIIKDIEQGSDEWHAMRVGVITASRFSDVLSKGKGITRQNYMIELAAEILTGQRAEGFTSSAMEWGTQTEPQARATYELNQMVDIEEVTFIRHGEIRCGYSPDGLVGQNGLIEIKCPKTTTQIETVMKGKMPTKHAAQVQGGLWVSERDWCDFVSFDPRIDGKSGYFCERIFRDEIYIANLEREVKIFENELFEMVEKLR